MIEESSIAKVHDRIDIVDLISRHVQLQRKGAVYVARCPFHNEKTASFMVSPARSSYHCFGCGAHGDGIDFIMRLENKTYPEAVEYIANLYGIRLMHTERTEFSDKEREEARRREAMFAAAAKVQQFFEATLAENTPEAKTARKYAYGRWGEKYCLERGIGLAPDSWTKLPDFCRENAIDEAILKEIGLLKLSEKSNSLYPFFRGRVTIPITDRFGRVIAFTARYIGSDPDVPKYINSTNSPIFDKSKTVFGFREAARAAAKSGRFFIVEGAPDVLRLQSDEVGVTEAVGSLGTAWSDDQFRLLQNKAAAVCFIPDADPPKHGNFYGAGILGVMKNGLRALALGLNVTVREIPLGDDNGNPVKNDPDSYIDSREKLLDLEEVMFPIWYGLKVLQSRESEQDKVAALNEISRDVLIHIKDETMLSICIAELAKEYGRVKYWRDAVKRAKGELKIEAEKKKRGEMSPENIALHEAGISVKEGCYYCYDGDANPKRLSNFIMRPLYHIIDKDNAIRIFRFINCRGGKSLIEFRQDELINLNTFKRKIESHGYFHFKGNSEQLDDIREVMSSITESAQQIIKMGWNDHLNLYAFGDGVLAGNVLHTVDDVGIVDVDDKKYYLPACSKMHSEDRDSYQYERSFSCQRHGEVSLKEYVGRLLESFGDNGKVAFAFLLATLFHDIVRAATGGKFPILNVYGVKGSGKTDMGRMLMAFFTRENEPPSMASTTVASMNDMLSRGDNILVHLDEYKNAIHFRKIEILKQIWGGTGQAKKNMDGDKKAQLTHVHSGVILTGQDMPKRDDALLSRVILLTLTRTSFTPEEKARFSELEEFRSRGCSHLTVQLLKLRSLFETDFQAHYDVCRKQMLAALANETIEDRTFLNWLVPLAAFHTVQTSLDLPYEYTDLFRVCISGLREQNRLLSKNSDVAEFWKLLDANHMQGKIVDKAHYCIRGQYNYKHNNGEFMDFGREKKLLYLNYQNVLVSLGQRLNGTTVIGKLDSASMESYLRNHPAFIGSKQYRFRVLLPNGTVDYVVEGGQRKFREVRPMALVFDYELLKEQYDINLETIEISEFDTLEDTSESPPESSLDLFSPPNYPPGTLVSDILNS